MTFAKLCAVCARPLAYSAAHDEWIHARDADHVVVPVDVGDILMDAQCDFCFADLGHKDGWTVPAEQFLYSGGLEGSRGNWLACDTCAELVRGCRWTQLINRAVDSHAARYRLSPAEVPAIRHTVTDIYARLAVHIVGPLRRRTDADFNGPG